MTPADQARVEALEDRVIRLESLCVGLVKVCEAQQAALDAISPAMRTIMKLADR